MILHVSVMQGQGGNPPANVTWFKDDIQIGETGKEEQTLTRRNVSAADSGTYKCVAESYPDAKFKDEGLITVIVKLKCKYAWLLLKSSIVYRISVYIKSTIAVVALAAPPPP